MRLDPFRLPEGIRFEHDGVSYTLHRDGAVLKTRLAGSQLALSMALPARAFSGVAARAIEHDDGSYTVSLELLHHDPRLSVPLLVSDHLADIAADWHAWSRLMRLPMLIVGAGALAQPVRNELGAILVETPFERRKRFAVLKHRPWFLRRRKPGAIGPVTRISGEELIARR
ncbi:MAG: hypothetical protein BroJett030_22960 [Alphaproteobacteria bacterium]|nr:MAG: hypothetical protein BroJett030_22960 [Alphaproteobacteria bacterium]